MCRRTQFDADVVKQISQKQKNNSCRQSRRLSVFQLLSQEPSVRWPSNLEEVKIHTRRTRKHPSVIKTALQRSRPVEEQSAVSTSVLPQIILCRCASFVTCSFHTTLNIHYLQLARMLARDHVIPCINTIYQNKQFYFPVSWLGLTRPTIAPSP